MVVVKRVILSLLLLLSSVASAKDISLREKIGQMLIFGFQGKSIEESSIVTDSITKFNLGGVILFDYDYQSKQFDRNIESPTQVATLNRSLQLFTKKANQAHHRPQLPLLITIDYEGGLVNRLREEYGFPKTYSAEEMGRMSKNDVRLLAHQMATTLRTLGFNFDFAPVLDLNTNSNNPIIKQRKRSFSQDPTRAYAYAQLFAQEFKKNGIGCAYKHFPGHGSANGDSHRGFVDVTDSWTQQELIPFQNAIADPNRCDFIMTAHIVNRHLDADGLPATLSYPMLTQLLQEKMGFDGIIVSDDMQMKAIANRYGLPEALTRSINAGVDMFIFGNQISEQPQQPKEIILLIEKLVQKGDIPAERINNAYQKIVRYKTLAGWGQ